MMASNSKNDNLRVPGSINDGDIKERTNSNDSSEPREATIFEEIQSAIKNEDEETVESTTQAAKSKSRLAKILGFNFKVFNPQDDPPSSPLNMGRVRLNSVDTPSSRRSLGPIEQSFYQIDNQAGGSSSQWAMNYQEAAIYLEEGFNNDKFTTHPKRKESLPAYILAHTSWFYLLDISASILIILLAFIEPPTTFTFVVPVAVHASLELGGLAVIAFGLFLKLRWLGIKTIYTHHRTLIKALTLVVMIAEAVVVLIRQSSHVRVTRALRPLFLVDNRYFRGVRRFTREVLLSLPPIFDMLLLQFFLIFIFALLGHFLFGHDSDDPFFTTIEDSFVSLFVLMTTANYPDVMMPAYNKNRFSVFFFVAYLATVLYLFMNLLLAVVYDTFTTLEKEKFRKLVVHKRNACNFAFNLLVSKSHTNGIIFKHFYGMMTNYSPKKSLRDIYLTFRALDKKGKGTLEREDFSRFFEFDHLKWKPLSSDNFQKDWILFRDIGILFQRFLNSPYSEYLFNSMIVLNTVAMIARIIEGQTYQGSWDSWIFSVWFLAEMSLKMATWGQKRIFSSGWHSFDLIACLGLFVSLICVQFVTSWDELLTFLRPLRLLRLFKLKKRYRDVFGTIFILIPPMSSVATVMLMLYYFYSIVGMEIFANIPLRNCCNGSILESYYVEIEPNSTTFALRYYLNTFSNIVSSYVTLFELTVVNNWYVIMEGHVMVTNRLSRIYFISFYLVTMVLLTIIVAFILDSFLFRIQYKRQMDKSSENKMLRTEVSLTAEEIDFCHRHEKLDPNERYVLLQDYSEDLADKGFVTYVGFRTRNKEILYKRMFKNEIPDWIKETEPILHR